MARGLRSWRRVSSSAWAAVCQFRLPRRRFLCSILRHSKCDLGVVAYREFIYTTNAGCNALDVFSYDGRLVRSWPIRPAHYPTLDATRTPEGLDLIIVSDKSGFGTYTTAGVWHSQFVISDGFEVNFVAHGDEIIAVPWRWPAGLAAFSLYGTWLRSLPIDSFVRVCQAQGELVAFSAMNMRVINLSSWDIRSRWKVRWPDLDCDSLQSAATNGQVVFAVAYTSLLRLSLLRLSDGRPAGLWSLPFPTLKVLVPSTGHRMVLCPKDESPYAVYALE